jgi:hypothetical protein
MTFVLARFRTFDNIRQYDFEAVGEDQHRQHITVGADLNLVRRYGIPPHELPLLFEGHTKIKTTTFTEGEMAQYANAPLRREL